MNIGRVRWRTAARIAATICAWPFAVIGAPTVASVSDLVEHVDGAWTNDCVARAVPPASVVYNRDLGILGYAVGFDTNFIAGLCVVSNGTVATCPLLILETNTTPRTRVFYDANGTSVHTASVDTAGYPESWIEEVYGEHPPWLTGNELDTWYALRDPARQRVHVTLVSTSDVPAYIARLTNAVGSAGASTNAIPLLSLYSNAIAFVGMGATTQTVNLYLHAPEDIARLDLFDSTNLTAVAGDWWLAATLDHEDDPILWSATSAGSNAFYCAGDADADTDGDGLADIREMRIYGTDPLLADTDGDGILDGAEVLTYDLDPSVADSDSDGVSDGLALLTALSPSDPDAEAPVTAAGTFGDYGIGSRQSERYILRSLPLDSSDTGEAFATWLNPSTNTATSYSHDIPLGAARTLNLRWWSHTNDSRNVVCDQDYRWHMTGIATNDAGWYWMDRCVVDQSATNGPVYSPFTNSTPCYAFAGKGAMEVHYVDKVTQDLDFGGTVEYPEADGAPGKRVDVYVPVVDLDNDVDHDGAIGLGDALIESTGLGAVVCVNDDDDNTNDVPDRLETAESVSGEDDLHLVRFSFGPMTLPTGTVQLAIAAGSDRIRVWTHPEKGEDYLLLSAANPSTNWVLAGTSSWSAIPTNLWVETLTNSAAEGDCALAARFLSPTGATLCADTNLFTALRVGLIPDYDRSGEIDALDRMHAATNLAFRFWVNDDDDAGYEDGSDIPHDGREDWKDTAFGPCGVYRVDGVRDFIDFFPVFVDLKTTLDLLGMDSYRYYLKHPDGAVNALIGEELSLSDADNHLYDKDFCEDNSTALLRRIKSSGYQLPYAFLDAVQTDGKGVILLEARTACTNDLILEVRKTGGGIVYSVPLTLSLSAVNDMFRCINLRDAAGGSPVAGDFPVWTNEPPNYPDALCTETNLLFVHGFMPDSGEETTSGWIAEMFKRFHAAGSRARFHGVQWRSGEDGKLNYQQNVYNAFLTASNLSAYVADLPGASAIAAHSLGNVLVSSAIADHAMPVDSYFMLDAAVAAEAFDASVTNDSRMVHTWWEDYTNTCWAANWHNLFDASDTRSRLTWANRFTNALASSTVYNFYSTGDEVFELTTAPSLLSGVFYAEWWFILPVPDWDGGHHSWQKQEVFKGTLYLDWLGTWGATKPAGWGLNSTWAETPSGSGEWEVVPVYTPTQAALATPAMLRTNPVFRCDEPSWLVGTNVLTQAQQNEMLAKGIAALTPSAGRTAMPEFADVGESPRQFDLNIDASFRPNGWPRDDSYVYDEWWCHNDLRVIAYLYVYEVYRRMIEKGGLK